VQKNSPEAVPAPAPINAPFNSESDWRTTTPDVWGVCAAAIDAIEIVNMRAKAIRLMVAITLYYVMRGVCQNRLSVKEFRSETDQ
jgi:hypothetical protein